MALLLVIALGMLSLAAIEVRKSSARDHRAHAEANARLALLQAIGRLQELLGPDQRVCASAGILGSAGQQHWTGVWSSRQEDGSSFWQRDAQTGSLRDTRSDGYDPAAEVMGWLVSGKAGPAEGPAGDESIELVGEASVGAAEENKVVVPVVELDAGAGSGRIAWWVGDLGVRANIGTPDRHAGQTPDPVLPDWGGYYRAMLNQDAETALMSGELQIDDAERMRLVSEGSATAASLGGDWAREHFHDYTVWSRGVLVDVRDGGLKGDLSAFFESDGTIPPKAGLAGLDDLDRLVAAGDESAGGLRFERTAPCFGMLRNWARVVAPFSGRGVGTVMPDTDSSAGRGSEMRSLCNENPARLERPTRTNLQPVLVEATDFVHLSTFATNNDALRPRYQIRQHMYPRVVLWNPFNVELDFEPAIVMIQGNGRQEMWTESDYHGRKLISQWLMFEGGRSTSFNLHGIMNTEGYNDPYMGSYYFSIPRTRFGPGECLVFSPARSAEYDGLSVYRPGPYNLANNELSCEVAPDPSRSYYVSDSEIGGGVPFRPLTYWFAPTPVWSRDGRGVVNQADDWRVVMKSLSGAESEVTFESFDKLPQLAYVSASLQYGAGREPRISWNKAERMPMEFLPRLGPRPAMAPNVRTRQGIRLRWFEEHPSNLLNAGELAGTAFFEEAPLANWNLRGTYALRSPWENIGGSMPIGGGASGPWFFGIYTRDLFDSAVSWEEQEPVFRNGRYHGNPFGRPQEGRARYVMYDLPRSETGVVSLGQFQHAKLSELVWHPSFAIGNSLADPRLGLEGLAGTVPNGGRTQDELNGFHPDAIGWSDDGQRSGGRDDWGSNARALLHDLPRHANLVYDLSFEVNHTLWDRYFVSSGGSADKWDFLDDPVGKPLPNGRMKLVPGTEPEPDDLTDYHRAASALMVDGAFNVNSTSAQAWRALLASARGCGFRGVKGTPVLRMLDPPGDAWRDGRSADDDSAWAGFRELTDSEIVRLADAIVEEVKLRGPFLSLADFVNRRLVEDDTGRGGALQAAIDRAGLNAAFESGFPLANDESLGDYRHPDNIQDSTRIEQQLKPRTKAWGVPGFLTQGDLLASLGPVLSARSDTFVVRAYGDSTDAAGRVRAKAWCEAVVQRFPVPLDPDDSGLNPSDPGGSRDFGRRFGVVSFRWLQPGEI